MKYIIALVALCAVSLAQDNPPKCDCAHGTYPEIQVFWATVDEMGEHFPPKLEDDYLPPFAVWNPWPGVIVPVVAP